MMPPALRELVARAQAVGNSASLLLSEAPMPLQPHTARLCQQVLRLSKGVLTAVDDWLKQEQAASGPRQEDSGTTGRR